MQEIYQLHRAAAAQGPIFFSILGLKATDFLDKIEQTAPPNRQNFLGAFGAENAFLLLSYPVHPKLREPPLVFKMANN